MVIRNLEYSDISEITILHKRIFGKTHFSSTFDKSLLDKYFRALVDHHDFKYVAVDDSRITGYLIAGKRPEVPVNRFFKKNTLAIILILLKNPYYLIEKIWAVFLLTLSDRKNVSNESLSVYLIAVDPSAQKMGIGKKLLEYFEQKIIEKGIDHYTLAVRKNNAKAIEFYLKNNFVQVAKNYKTISFRKDLGL